MNIKKVIFKNKNFKLGYYLNQIIINLLPHKYFLRKKTLLFQKFEINPNPDLLKRLEYYCPLSEGITIFNQDFLTANTLMKPTSSKVYYYDMKRFLKYFNRNQKFLLKSGDNIDILSFPHFVKSRPIKHSSNEIVLKLNAIRHFNFIKDSIPFEAKENKLFGRLAVYQDVRKRFFNAHFNNPICDIGDVAKGTESIWLKPKTSINKHLKYKFILALEGNDVATNLKWIMSSNSIAVMPQPKYETWFMEGLLQPNVHYICIKDDFSDLNEQLDYYIHHPKEALKIIKNANEWVAQFKNHQQELYLNLMVMQRYFNLVNIKQ
jgi:hypothetical protein